MRFGWLLVWRCLKVSNHGFAEGRGHADCQFAAPWTTLHNFRFFAACAPRPGYSHHDFESITVYQFHWCFGKFAPTCGRIYHAGRQVISGDDVNVQVDAGRVYFQHHNWRRLRRMLSQMWNCRLIWRLWRQELPLIWHILKWPRRNVANIGLWFDSQNWTNNFVSTPRGHQSRPSKKTRSSIEGFCM